ncbi:hypothetical protein F5050DRAFT_1807083 [Lentinula boryana]|uniref:PAZ domain-containing protein n=1 Tax=Lentinula boryana TaxID=40481 RepID=A0ABQ8QEY6_9AGAR|nr:hypothetical protein F5050DRAFT_1807083 [Lentinula boryana]
MVIFYIHCTPSAQAYDKPYDFTTVSIKPNFNGPGGKDINIGKEKGTEVIQRLQVNVRPDLFPKPGAFDGKKNLLLGQVLHGNEQGNPSSIGPGTVVASSLNMLQAFLQPAPKMANGNLHKGKSVYMQWRRGYQQSSDKKSNGIDDRIRPLRLVDGFFQSARMTTGHLIVNIDLSVGVIFDRNGIPTTIRDYFLSTHGARIPSQSVGVVIGNHEIFTVSVCVVPERLYKSKLQPEHVRKVLSFVPKNPRERLQRIKAGWQNLEYENSEFLKGANITVHPDALTIHGRILPSPNILYSGASGTPPRPTPLTLTLAKPGTWDVMRKRFWSPARPSFVLILNMNKLMGQLFNTLKERGVGVYIFSSV